MFLVSISSYSSIKPTGSVVVGVKVGLSDLDRLHLVLGFLVVGGWLEDVLDLLDHLQLLVFILLVLFFDLFLKKVEARLPAALFVVFIFAFLVIERTDPPRRSPRGWSPSC
jgi:hypothetical protein